ncbi:hypothetical protein LTR70_000541 [Exophiala xenobiotica]|uniref:C2H2-type domain-containing protein n=1 Tax=Lithohypha guttulata TaxID=1690604 RepID=A0ABR0KB79_9EURO|nr:hypothetical protein LTR24_004651 [Lithohypha guttulata]KAK5329392.1 hypothetical protein LTR70_000541 [Exophiala xenobiotica]
MATTNGLRLALTFCGFIQHILPQVLTQNVDNSRLVLNGYLTNLRLQRDNYLTKCRLRIVIAGRQGQYLLRRTKDRIINQISPPKSRLLQMPREVRDHIYRLVVTPQTDGYSPAVLHLLLTNKQICHEVKPFVDAIEHTITIGDLERFKAGTIEYMGVPKTIRVGGELDWHMASLKHLVLNLKVCGIAKMTPDCFDVSIAPNGKEQWRNLKRLIGIWPEIRHTPLESVRLDVAVSGQTTERKTYRVDLIRVIRNFKRTKVWAETADGDCSAHRGNRSLLLPLVKAFNQGRRNWDTESDIDNNLIVRYDAHILSARAVVVDKSDDEKSEEEQVEAVRNQWSVQPVNDTSRSDNSVWPEWTGKEEVYIREKMVRREREHDRGWECHQCLAVFDRPLELKAHIARGKRRT